MKKLLTFCLCLLLLGGAVLALSPKIEYTEKQEEATVAEAFSLLKNAVLDKGQGDTSLEYIFYAQEIQNQGKNEVRVDGVKALDYQESHTYAVNVTEAGTYYLALEYHIEDDVLSEFVLDVKINDKQDFAEMKTVALPLSWYDESKEFPIDRYLDEASPMQYARQETIKNDLYDTNYSTILPLEFTLEKGENQITITNISGNGLTLEALEVRGASSTIPSYADYKGSGSASAQMLTINAIDYVSKNSTAAMYGSDSDPSTEPFDNLDKKLNVISYTAGGIQLDYEVEVPEDGLYELSFHYSNRKEEVDSFFSIYLDGAVPFTECLAYALPSTGNDYANHTLADENGNAYLFSLTAGTHQLSLRSEIEPVMLAWSYGRLIAEHATQFGLDITKIAGNTVDENRTWRMTQYIDNIPEYLAAYEVLVKEIKYLLQDYSTYGINSAPFADLDKVLTYVESMAEYPDEIALHITELTGSDASVLTAISSFTSTLLVQDMHIDRIYLGNSENLPSATAGVWGEFANSTSVLLNSFTTNKYDVKEKSDEVLTVWVNRATTHVSLLQRMVDTEFTPQTGIDVQISVMPDVNKLTLSASAGDTPDLALGLASHIPFELASRGALYDLSQFDDFWEVASRSVPGVYVPYTYNDAVYAIPETIDFHILAYRLDIFQSLGIEPPETWEDLVGILPTLQRYGMNFYHNISAGVGYKWFYQTSSLIFQNNGRIYADDGLSSALDDKNSVAGLQQLGNLFINYSLDTQVNSFLSSFRYAILPVGIIDSNEYILLKNGAPELDGQWAVVPYPGTEQEDGTIDRSYVASSTGGVIFSDSQMVEEGYEFLKWWTDYETQVSYSHTLKSTYGDQFFWLSANVEALGDAPIPIQEKEVILEQIQWINDVPRTPGQYLVERSISDAWNDIVFNGTSAQVVVDEAIIEINREIKKKMTELGFYGEDGTLAKSYVIRDRDWIAEQMEQFG
ncbi:MAG: extracellular solute-binding protein [Eubacteriales bacterium]